MEQNIWACDVTGNMIALQAIYKGSNPFLSTKRFIQQLKYILMVRTKMNLDIVH